MFTGLVQSVGRVVAREPREGGVRLAIACAFGDGAPLELGESIAVAGTCLTVATITAEGFIADVSGETLRLTTLGERAPGDGVNLERALRAGDRLGGHLVSGHVDGIGALRDIGEDGLSRVYRFTLPSTLHRYVAVKGSIAIDGVSLTINTVDADGFGVNLIPHTLAHTTLGSLSPGARVNIEIDQVARYVERLLAVRDPTAPSHQDNGVKP